MNKHHELKSWPQFYKDVEKGYKTVEVRCNDRNYQPGDVVIFKEYVPPTMVTPEMKTAGFVDVPQGFYTGRELPAVRITYVLDHKDCPGGLRPGYCAFAFVPLV